METKVLNSQQAPLNSFHDCHVYGLSWKNEEFSFKLDIDYLLKWIKPTPPEVRIKFIISRALLNFVNVHSVILDIEWDSFPLETGVERIIIEGSKTLPNGDQLNNYRISFNHLDGDILILSGGYEVILIGEPTEKYGQKLR